MTIRTNKVSMRRLRPSPAMVVSLFALLIAMSTGAYAAVTIAPDNSVVSKSIKNENVKTEDLAAQAVSKGKLKKAAVNGDKILDGSVGTKDLGDGQVNSAKILDGSIVTADIASAAKAELSHGGPAYSKHFETGFSVPTTMTTIAALNLPAGSYVLMSKAQIDTFNGGDIIDCDLVDGLNHKDQSFVQGGSSHQSQIITNNLVTTYVTGGTASLQCQTYGGGGISQVRLTAINVSSVSNSP